jgi:hypothetical protein
MATITLTLKARNKKDGTSPIVIRIRYKGRFFDIPTGESIIERCSSHILSSSLTLSLVQTRIGNP